MEDAFQNTEQYILELCRSQFTTEPEDYIRTTGCMVAVTSIWSMEYTLTTHGIRYLARMLATGTCIELMPYRKTSVRWRLNQWATSPKNIEARLEKMLEVFAPFNTIRPEDVDVFFWMFLETHPFDSHNYAIASLLWNLLMNQSEPGRMLSTPPDPPKTKVW